MNKRNLASALWFLAGWFGGSLMVGLLALPAVLALLPGVILAILVRVDPGGFMWSRTGTGRRIVPINQFAAELDRKSDKWAAEANRKRV